MNKCTIYAFYMLIKMHIFSYGNLFYKTMPAHLQLVYGDLKYCEELIIQLFQKEFPEVPKHEWEKIKHIEHEVKRKLMYGASDQKEPAQEDTKLAIPSVASSLQEWEIYAQSYFIHECKRLGIHHELIKFECTELDINLGEAEIMHIKIDVKKHLAYQNASLRLHQTMKHELSHITEAHHKKNIIIHDLIRKYAGIQFLLYTTYYGTDSNFINLYNCYRQIQELQANILPAILDDIHFKNVKHFNLLDRDYLPEYSNTHPNAATKMRWLKRIEEESSNIAKEEENQNSKHSVNIFNFTEESGNAKPALGFAFIKKYCLIVKRYFFAK
ncbi:hypothetical protein EKK58_03080 [Candidatus Dependentiae bacterium]|nr:MAG: hypothetical protein EKK58_03080 [Candidatus Dependentiae bacterium]